MSGVVAHKLSGFGCCCSGIGLEPRLAMSHPSILLPYGKTLTKNDQKVAFVFILFSLRHTITTDRGLSVDHEIASLRSE